MLDLGASAGVNSVKKLCKFSTATLPRANAFTEKCDDQVASQATDEYDISNRETAFGRRHP